MPFVDVIRYRHSLKETAIDIPAQVCITRDNVQVGVDGILYLKVLNPERASYGISDFGFAITQLAQTMLRSEIGKIDLDRTFEERDQHQRGGRDRARQGVGGVGRQGAALRDQEHHAAARRAGRDGKADARRAREARRDPDVGRRSAMPRSTTPKARSSRSSRRRKRASSSRSTKPRVRRRRSCSVATAHGRRHPPRRRNRSAARRLSRRSSCASPSSTWSSSGTWRRSRPRSCSRRTPRTSAR